MDKYLIILLIIILFMIMIMIITITVKSKNVKITLNNTISILSPVDNIKLSENEKVNFKSNIFADWKSDIQGTIGIRTKNITVDLLPGIHKITVSSPGKIDSSITVKKAPYIFNGYKVGSNIYTMFAGYVYIDGKQTEFILSASELGTGQQTYNSKYRDSLTLKVGNYYYNTFTYKPTGYSIDINGNKLICKGENIQVKNMTTNLESKLSFNFVLDKYDYIISTLDQTIFDQLANKNDQKWIPYPLVNCTSCYISINNVKLNLDMNSIVGAYEHNFKASSIGSDNTFSYTYNIPDIKNKTMYFALGFYNKRPKGTSLNIDFNEIKYGFSFKADTVSKKLEIFLYPLQYGIEAKMPIVEAEVDIGDNTLYLKNFSEYYISFTGEYLIGTTEFNYMYQTDPVVDKNVKVQIVTGKNDLVDGLTGTDDDVYINFGNKSFKLDKPYYDDFESNDSTTYFINDPSLTEADIKRFSIELKPGVIVDDWYLKEIGVFYKNKMVLWERPETILKSGNLVWYNYPVIKVQIQTGTKLLSGTENDVYITFGNGVKHLLDKPNYIDFETGDNDIYVIDDNTLKYTDLSTFSLEIKPNSLWYVNNWYVERVSVFNNVKLVKSVNPNVWLTKSSPKWKSF